MRIINDLPFFMVVFAVVINIILGIKNNVDFTVLMVRSIIVTIVFAVLGLLMSSILSNAVETVNKKSKGTGANKTGSQIDIMVPPSDDEDLLNYGLDDEEFQEINPAFLHKRGDQE